ncbi:MAG: nucleoside triphosphate pyrophosphohydrolase, partial [Alphaproteobacteria bacterium]
MTVDPKSENLSPIENLLDVMARLRDPENGCPWDKEQTFETIAPYTIE